MTTAPKLQKENFVNDADPRKKLAYDESVRSLQLQSGVLDDLRGRTGILLTALSLTATFLGARALDLGGFSKWSWAAIAFFGVSALCCLWILRPGGKWTFTTSATYILREYVDGSEPKTLDEVHVALAEDNQKSRDENNDALDNLYLIFTIAIVALVLQVGFWLAALGTSHASPKETSEKTAQTQPLATSQDGANGKGTGQRQRGTARADRKTEHAQKVEAAGGK
jgi:hypothetical protein